MSTHPRNSGPRGVGPATIEIFRPCPDPPICVTSSDDAWSVCAAVRVDGDALLAVLVDRHDQLLAVTAAGPDFVAAASRDPGPLIRMLDVFEAARVLSLIHI